MTGADGELERQVERGSLFTHTALSETADRLAEAETFLYGLVDVLLAKGLVTDAELTAARDGVAEELVARGELPRVAVSLRLDPPAGEAPVAVDCAARMHVCQAVCCKLHFALTAEEVEAGRVKWDLGRPYLIRQTPAGCCAHNDRSTGACTVYDDRPALCRSYSCAHDPRIWSDFDGMVLNTEWLDEHLGSGTVRLQQATMRFVPSGAA